MLKLDYDHAGAAEYIEQRFSTYLPIVASPGPEDIRASFDHDPYFLGGEYPVQTVEEGIATGEPDGRSNLPAQLIFTVRFYQESLSIDPVSFTQAGEIVVSNDGRSQAKRLTRRIGTKWEAAFRDDRELRKQVRNMYISSVEAGDFDRLGNPIIGEGRNRLLWIHQITVTINP